MRGVFLLKSIMFAHQMESSSVLSPSFYFLLGFGVLENEFQSDKHSNLSKSDLFLNLWSKQILKKHINTCIILRMYLFN